MDKLEPDEVTHKGNNHGLVEKGGNDIKIHSIDPLGFQKDAHDPQDRDREKELIEKGIDRMDPLGHELFNVEGCGAPEKSRSDLQDIPD